MDPEKTTFFSHVFNFETDSRNEIINIIQYCIFAVMFIMILNKGVQTYMPELDKDKGTIAISVEILIHVIVLFVGILFIHRIITFIPTFSGIKYADQNIITTILPVVVVLLSISKLGEKVSILMDRVMGDKVVSTPVKLTPMQPLGTNTPQLLPHGVNTGNPMSSQGSQEPDFNTMFSGPSTPIVTEQFEPMPSNYGGSNIF
jgi:hypothetical protein